MGETVRHIIFLNSCNLSRRVILMHRQSQLLLFGYDSRLSAKCVFIFYQRIKFVLLLLNATSGFGMDFQEENRLYDYHTDYELDDADLLINTFYFEVVISWLSCVKVLITTFLFLMLRPRVVCRQLKI